MKKIFRCASAIIALMLVFTAFPALAQTDAEAEIIRYYEAYGTAAQTDILRLAEELDEASAENWINITERWAWTDTEMEISMSAAQSGLPEDSSLCIVVLGYALREDGSMQDELIGRLNVALKSAEKYPNAYIACTGGGTAANAPNVTEADSMAVWLAEHGADPSRIIVENKSRNTVENARNTVSILAERYPEVSGIAIVTSDYHVKRGCLLYSAEAILKGADIEVIGNGAFETGKAYEDTSLIARSLAALAEVNPDAAEAPVLSRLTKITVSGKENITVTAKYNSGFSRDVTDKSQIEGNTVRYTENGITKTALTGIPVTAVIAIICFAALAAAAVLVNTVCKKK